MSQAKACPKDKLGKRPLHPHNFRKIIAIFGGFTEGPVTLYKHVRLKAKLMQRILTKIAP